VRPVEVYRGRLILYGCGDFLDDYEGIQGHGEFRGDLALMYLVTLDAATGALAGLRMVPLQIRKMSLHHADPADTAWLAAVLTNLSVGCAVEQAGGVLELRDW
jgi:poly-gamma-glutamate synthesis protein (capsule biosynthesis protein)